MKRIILLLCLPLVLVSACYAKEKIKIDHMKDGYRIIQTERTHHIFPYKRNLTDAAISLDVVEYGKKDYSICIYLFADLNIYKGSKLLLKLDNDEIVELEADLDSETVRNLIFTTVQIITFTSYKVTEEQIHKIIENNVVKVRMETSYDYFDAKVYKDKFSKTIYKDYLLIEDALQEEISIYDNF